MLVQRDDPASAISGGIMLIGLGVIYLLKLSFWPWILVVLAFATLAHSVAQGGIEGGLIGAVVLIILAILFLTGTFWPGILILLGVSMLFGGIVRSSRRR
jgi:hypothetical protein